MVSGEGASKPASPSSWQFLTVSKWNFFMGITRGWVSVAGLVWGAIEASDSGRCGASFTDCRRD